MLPNSLPLFFLNPHLLKIRPVRGLQRATGHSSGVWNRGRAPLGILAWPERQKVTRNWWVGDDFAWLESNNHWYSWSFKFTILIGSLYRHNFLEVVRGDKFATASMIKYTQRITEELESLITVWRQYILKDGIPCRKLINRDAWRFSVCWVWYWKILMFLRQQAWCCVHEQLGCPNARDPIDFDCSALVWWHVPLLGKEPGSYKI